MNSTKIIEKLKGTGVAMITPFTKDGSVDFDSLGKIIKHLITGGINYITVLGTTGESAVLSTSEKKDIFSFVRKTVGDRNIHLMAGIGGNCTADVIKSFQTYDLSGYFSILSVCPYYNKPNQAGLFNHYKALARETPLPIILYNVPGRTSVNLSYETTLQLADVENIAGIKEASGNVEQCMQIIKDKPGDFLVISGDDALTLPMISLGACGVISVAANAFPEVCSKITTLAMEDNYKEARALHYKLLSIINMLFAEGNPAGIKAFMKHLGLCEDYLRLPLVPINKKLEKEIIDSVHKMCADRCPDAT